MLQNIDTNFDSVLSKAIEKAATDIILLPGVPIAIRIDGSVVYDQNNGNLTADKVRDWIKSTMVGNQYGTFETQKELDYSFSHRNQRFRANAYYQKGLPALSLRILASRIKNYEELGLPPILSKFTKQRQGFFLVTGPTGHGKSTTLASMIEEINQTRNGHIVTIEDPIEYVFEHKRSIISQREVGVDTHSFSRALRSAVREDPNVILIGEMRDYETVDAALSLAETGHLVFSTLHTNSAAQTADRVVDMFPPYLQDSTRKLLANVLLGVISQRLIPKSDGGRVVAAEILIANSAVRTLIRENKSHQLDNVIATSASEGMVLLDKVIAELISQGEITLDSGLMWANDPKAVKGMLY